MKKVLGLLMSAAFIIAVVWIARKLPVTSALVGGGSAAPAA